MHYVNDRNIVEDIVQDFFVNLWFDAPSIQIRTSVKAYLYTSIRNRSLDYLKHLKVEEKFHKKTLLKNESDNSFENYLAESELRHLVEKSLDKLPPRCREIFELNRFKGMTNQQIADHLGISKRTVELQISNSLKILREELREYLPLFVVTMLF